MTAAQLRSSMDQADARLRDALAAIPTRALVELAEASSAMAHECPATVVLSTIRRFPCGEAFVAAAINRALTQLVLSRLEADELRKELE